MRLTINGHAHAGAPRPGQCLRTYLRDYARSGRTVLVSSHQLGEVLHLADDATIIAGGTVRFAGELRELGPNLEESFFQLTRGAAR